MYELCGTHEDSARLEIEVELRFTWHARVETTAYTRTFQGSGLVVRIAPVPVVWQRALDEILEVIAVLQTKHYLQELVRSTYSSP